MAELIPVASWDGIYKIAIGDGIGPAPEGVSNDPHQALANRGEYLRTEINKIAPVGTILIVPTDTVPDGYFEMDGSELSRTTYAALFAYLGTKYGDGDGSLTFNIPDYRGQFLRGWAHGSAVDPDRASRTDRGDGTTGDFVGTGQADELESHVHDYVWGETFQEASPPQISKIDVSNTTVDQVQATGGNETRPVNRTVMYCIRYKEI